MRAPRSGRLGLLLALLVGSPMASAANAQQPETVEYYGQDVVGSIRIVFDVNGATLGRQDYLPFGRPLFPVPDRPSEGLGAQERDAESAQEYFHARLFTVRLGRFAAPDPLFTDETNPQTWNRYAYALNNPLAFTDYSGLEVQGAPNPELCTPAIREMNPKDWHCIGGGEKTNNGSTGIAEFFVGILDAFLGTTTLDAGELHPTQRREHASERVRRVTEAAALAAAIISPIARASSAKTTASAAAAEGTNVIIKAGTVINRVWDSRWTKGSKYSGPFGTSYSPGSWLPTSARVATIDRGLSPLNNAQRGALFEVMHDIPAIMRTSIGGVTPELVIAGRFSYMLRPMSGSVSRLPR